jgi:ribonuclease VapC
MVVDTSAVLAILLHERDAGVFAGAIENADERRISAANYLEAAVVIDSRGDAVARREFDRFFERAGIVVEAVTLEQARIARLAYQDFGKGRHRAGLNFGDCLAYALARALDQPLLYKGRDFSRTDVLSALEG